MIEIKASAAAYNWPILHSTVVCIKVFIFKLLIIITLQDFTKMFKREFYKLIKQFEGLNVYIQSIKLI